MTAPRRRHGGGGRITPKGTTSGDLPTFRQRRPGLFWVTVGLAFTMLVAPLLAVITYLV